MRAPFLSFASRIVRAVTLAPRPIAAQAAAENAAALRKSYLGAVEELQGKFLQLAEAFPADKYAWRPAPGVRSVGEVFMHIASEYYLMPPMAFGATASP